MIAASRQASRNRAGSRGFSLIELLVVIAIIAILTALLMPALVSAKEKGRRAACKNGMRQFILAINLYAADYGEKVPSGLSEFGNGEDEHIPVVSRATRDSLIRYAGSYRILDCPSLGKPFNQEKGWYYGGYGFVIGYNYLGGHTNTPWPPSDASFARWESPQNLNALPTLPLLTDMNDWSPGFGKSFAPHAARGPILKNGNYSNPGPRGFSSATIGAVGGNIGLVDGSVNWKKIAEMQNHNGSRNWGDEGCFASW